MLQVLESVGIAGILDILFMTLIIYSVLVWFKRTKAGFAAIGLFMVGAAYLIARQLGMSLTTTVFQGFFAIILIAIVIIFQEEIRRYLEQLVSRSIFEGRRLAKHPSSTRGQLETLANVADDLARAKIGAIIVLRGKDPVARYLSGGVSLDGKLSESLIKSIFAPGSAGHDGAIVVEGDRVTGFSYYLPLSENLTKLQKTGTRHAAALGLAERTDALCLIVSEERGTISVSRSGGIHVVRDSEELKANLEAFYAEITPTGDSKPWKNLFRRNSRELGLAFAATLVLWFFFVYESKMETRSYVVPITCETTPLGLYVERIEPSEVSVTFSGPRRLFLFMSKNRINIDLKLSNVRRGTLRRTITRSDLAFPEGLLVDDIQPNEVTVKISEKTQ
jgi:diadenylate cyclase